MARPQAVLGGAAFRLARSAATTTVEPGERPRETFARERRDVAVVGLVEEFLDLVLTDGEPTQAGLDTLHGECEQRQQHWEKHHSESLHRGK